MKDIANQIVLRNGTVINLTSEQNAKLTYVILTTPKIDEQEVKVGGHKFKLKDILTEQEKVELRKQQAKDSQQKML